MSSMRWRAFFLCNSVTRPFVHFFPHSATSTAPYPVVATISIFGAGVKNASVSLEGARLSQPDGVRLDAIFADLAEGAQGLVGLEVELSSAQRRIDLSASQVAVELTQGRNSTRFFASPVSASNVGTVFPFPSMLNDAFSTTVVAVNAGNAAAKAVISNGGDTLQSKTEVSVEAHSVKEIMCDSLMDAVKGEVRDSLNAFSGTGCTLAPTAETEDLSFFALYRDVNSKAPSSVMAL